jgi:hypothetical protein
MNFSLILVQGNCFFWKEHYNDIPHNFNGDDLILMMGAATGESIMNNLLPVNQASHIRHFRIRHPPLTFPGFFYFFGILFLLSVTTACNGSDTPPVSHGGPVRDHVSLIDAMRAQGLTVEPTGSITQPFFPVPGHGLLIDGEDLQVFEFDNPSSANAKAREISPDGETIGKTVVQWIAPPHFFLSGKIIVLYLGDNPELLKHLETALGKPIAGAHF